MKDFAIYHTKFGYFAMQCEDDCLIYCKMLRDETIRDFGKKTLLTDKAYHQLLEYFDGNRKTFDLPLRLCGTEFQKKVWHALCEIPYGETRSYQDVAIAVGSPKAGRAVGMANNKNPIAVIVPCHRVIGASGKLVGYAGGLAMKESLLHMESEHR